MLIICAILGTLDVCLIAMCLEVCPQVCFSVKVGDFASNKLLLAALHSKLHQTCSRRCCGRATCYMGGKQSAYFNTADIITLST